MGVGDRETGSGDRGTGKRLRRGTRLGKRARLVLIALAWSTGVSAQSFPVPDRPVAAIVSSSWDEEHRRDGAGEADKVFTLLGLAPGMRVADVGAGSGYYTSRLAKLLGATGVVYAEDIEAQYVADLRKRVEAESLGTVRVILGTPDDPLLPAGEVDVALLSHMYHEITNPYALLWHLWHSLAPGGRVAIIDLDRATERHGTPPALLRCELGAVGYREVSLQSLEPASGYLAVYAPNGDRPAPQAIRACRKDGTSQ